MKFTHRQLPGDRTALIPADIHISLPSPDASSGVAEEHLHSLAYIPWDKRYLQLVPQEYRAFYEAILPRLNARSTDVHTALSASFIEELIEVSDQMVDRRILTISVLLHDIGWALLTPAQIAMSLNYSAFTYNEEALRPKRLHASLGSEVARMVLDAHRSELELSDQDVDFIVKLVRFHDHIDPWPEKPEPVEYLLLGDADRLWSYTHQNFWLDTIRKDTAPRQYVRNIHAAIDEYFLTDAGKHIARRLIAEREAEVSELESAVHASDLQTSEA